MTDRRVCFDFEIDFVNGGGVQGQGFRLDIDGDTIDDDALAAALIRELRLLMVGDVRILNKSVIAEPHKRAENRQGDRARGTVIDLSHTVREGMVTYPGLPGPVIRDHLSRLASHDVYAAGTEFQIGRIDMVSNTGTYIDVPFHRYADGQDLSAVTLERVSNLPGVMVDVTGAEGRAIDWQHFAADDVQGRAVLVRTGWDRHWGTDEYFHGHPFLTGAAALYLRDHGAALVGVDTLNIDSTDGGTRPVHTELLAAGIPIVEHMTNLAALPAAGFRFTAAPPKVVGIGTFTVRAHAVID